MNIAYDQLRRAHESTNVPVTGKPSMWINM